MCNKKMNNSICSTKIYNNAKYLNKV